ncbi:hypothetical protein H2204_010053 [Knufia peltigerae]|uniref:Uncharacterized protein n=1 Tax=Knufia peltigerae TaxID=1002370 RepID=A0AA39CT70_9EURO|nr:hypothetical protein H2204_010053 [Knufia peltigerae]
MSNFVAFLLLSGCSLAFADPVITAAAALVPRDTDPSFVGYIAEGGSYGNARSCDYPQTVSTSGAYVQCCPTTGNCPFYTSCSANTLFAAGGDTVPCDVSTQLTCNTGIVLPTPGAAGGPSYLACWQTSLGSSPFTFVQDIGTATAAPAGSTGSGSAPSATASGSAAASGSTASGLSSTGAASSSQSSAGSAETTSSSGSSSSSSSSSSSASASSAGSNDGVTLGYETGLVGGVVALLAQMLL